MENEKKLLLGDVVDKEKMKITAAVISHLLDQSELKNFEICMLMVAFCAERMDEKEHVLYLLDVAWKAKEVVDKEENND